MKKHLFQIVLIFTLLGKSVFAEPICHFRHYSTEDGLPQYTIMDILQDKNGFMWFGTWDGLSKFDGYRFQNFKVRPGDAFYMKSNRIEKLYDDCYGRIWFKTYDKEIHCFDANQHKFRGVEITKNNIQTEFCATGIEIKPSGKVWLFSTDNGCVEIKDSLFNFEYYNNEKQGIKGTTIYSVLEDKQKNAWLLTNNGISFIDRKSSEIKSFFSENTSNDIGEWQSFFSAVDMGKFIFFASQNGRLWKYDKQNGKFLLIRTLFNSSIKKIIQLSNDKLILLSENEGFIVYDLKKNTFRAFNTINSPEMLSNEISETFVLKSRYFWFTTKEPGIFRFDAQTSTLKYFKIKITDASTLAFPPDATVFEDVAGRTWVHPKGGGFSLLNPVTDNLDPFFNDRALPNWRFSNIIHSAHSDFQGNLWLCTRSRGLEKVVFDKNFFRKIRVNPAEDNDIANEVRMIFEDNNQNLWVSTKDGRLTIYDKNKKQLGRLNKAGQIVNDAVLPAVVYCAMLDNDKNIWLGTRGDGVYKLKKAGIKNYSVEHYRKTPTDVYSLSENSIYSILQDSKGKIWIGTYGGGLNLVQQQNDGSTVFINHRNNLKNFPIDAAYRIRFLAENKSGNICVGTTGGLIMFSSNFDTPENIKFNTYLRKPDDKECLSNNDIHGIYITHKGEMFLATFGGGLNKVIAMDKAGFPVRFKYYSVKDGLPSDVILSLMEDKYGMLWIGSENNMTRFNPEKEEFESFAEIKRLMTKNNFSEATSCRLKSNELMFGFSDGIISFQPAPIETNRTIPKIVFSNLQLFNKDVEVGAEDSPLEGAINSIKNLKLSHKQNFISIEYATLDFVDPDNIQYAYKLEGFDPDWNYVQKQRIANYTNLPKGNYVFRVKSTNSEGVWVENERTLPIEVLPSFWESTWAYILYLLLFSAVIYITLRILFTFYSLRGNIELEKKMSEMKLRFFTDISHEIRTPLTMITAPVENILSDDETPEKIKKQLKTISQNTNRMLRLVNQILDFRKIQFLHLKVQELEIDSVVEEICDTFSEIASEQRIKFRFINNAEGQKIWVDKDSFEKILMNLLSNAFKYTPPGKSILVVLSSDEKQVSIEVQDYGNGLSKEKQKNLFVRFAAFNDDKSKPSTGIGLSMVKDLVDKHGAKITVQSEEGKGSKFTVSFLRGIAHFDDTVEIMVGKINERQNGTTIETGLQSHQEQDVTSLTENKVESKYSVLIVEDDSELREFIKTTIENKYTVYEAVDGEDGWEKALKYSPDFVVSDIMMPNVDGIQLLQRLKSNIQTSHIPVMLLSAKTAIESKLEGLNFGADDYITKPFSVQYFKARIANLIQQRKQLQEIYRTKVENNIEVKTENTNTAFVYSPQDEEMLNSLISLIEENMESSDFQVEDLCKYVNMSRTVFFKKIKSLTGLPPVEFVREIRLKRAAQLLSTGKFMVKEVAYTVGIYDIRYFARCFKVKYGVTPLEYKNQVEHHQKTISH